MASLSQLQTWLTEAEIALHKLATGQSVLIAVDQNGERVEYTRANMAELRKYIGDLQAQIAAAGGTRAAAVGPMRPYFGR
jgi:hypothetical protein